MKIFKIAALSLVMASPLAAQTQEPYVTLFSDEGITARLTESGYTDIAIAREGTKLVINASKDGTAHEMVYNMTTGALIEVDGAGYSMGTPSAVAGEAESAGTSAAESDDPGTSDSNDGDAGAGGSEGDDADGDASGAGGSDSGGSETGESGDAPT